MKLTYEALVNDAGLVDRIMAQARRERAKAVHELILLPVKRLFTHHHATRPHLARQG
jgi:hypothetical protein